MPQQVNSFSGTSFRALPTFFHLPKSIDWKVAGCFTLVVGSLIFLALRFMPKAPNNSVGRSTTGSSSLAGRVDKYLPGDSLKSKSKEGASATPSPTHEIKPSDEFASLAGRADTHSPGERPKSESTQRDGASAAPSLAPDTKPSDPCPRAEASASVPPRQATKDGWTVISVDGEVTVSFSMNSNEVIDATRQFVTEKGGSVPCAAFDGYRRWLKSEIFTLNGEEYYLSFRQNEEHIDEMRFSLEKTKTSNTTKADLSPVHLKYVYKIGNNESQEGTKPLDFSEDKSMTILTPRRTVKVSGGMLVTFTVSFLKPETT